MGGTIIKTLKKELTFEFITFNGENMTEVLSFISLNRLNSSKCILDDYEKRPEDIPNLNEEEMRKWWISTGTITKNFNRYLDREEETNSHHSGNMPLWRKDELFKVDMKLNTPGYMRLVFFKKGDTIIYCDKMELDDDANFIVVDGPMTEEEIKEYIETHYGI